MFTLTREEFLKRINRGDYFINDNKITLSGRLINPNFDTTIFGVLHQIIDGIELTYYFSIGYEKYFNAIECIHHDDRLIFITTTPLSRDKAIVYNIPEIVTLYYNTSLDEWKEAINIGYKLVVDAIESGHSETYFTNDVYSKLSGTYSYIGDNICTNINKMLTGYKIHISKDEIHVSRSDVGSCVIITKL